MTGFRFSWRIENPTEIWTSSISEVGRSLQTPQLGEPLVNPQDESSDHTFEVVLDVPEDFQKGMQNENLVIELVMDMRNEDEVTYSTSYILGREDRQEWPDAEAECKREGGHLASVHSKGQQALAEKAAEGKTVWIGGRREGDAEWKWSDNSTWDFTNWESGGGESDETCALMRTNEEWANFYCTYQYSFLCQGDFLIPQENGLRTLDMKRDQLKFLPFHLTFKSKKKVNTEKKGKATGFTLNWLLKASDGSQLTEKMAPRQDDWRQQVPIPKYKSPLFVGMVQMTMQHRLENMSKEEILEEVIYKKNAKPRNTRGV